MPKILTQDFLRISPSHELRKKLGGKKKHFFNGSPFAETHSGSTAGTKGAQWKERSTC